MIKYLLPLVLLLGCSSTPTPTPTMVPVQIQVIEGLKTVGVDVCRMTCEGTACLGLTSKDGVLALVAISYESPVMESDYVFQLVSPGRCSDLPEGIKK